MGRKNINRGFKKLRICQDAISLYVLACKIFSKFPFELKKVENACNFLLNYATGVMEEWSDGVMGFRSHSI